MQSPDTYPDDDADTRHGPASGQDTLSVRPTSSRAAPIVLPSDPVESAALVLNFVQSQGTRVIEKSAAIEAALVRVQRLHDPNPEIAFSELASQALIVGALFERYSVLAVQATNSEAIVRFSKLAMQAQNTYTRTVIALEGLKQQRKGRASLTLDSDSDADTDD